MPHLNALKGLGPPRLRRAEDPVARLQQAREARERRAARSYAKEAKRTLKRERKLAENPNAIIPIPPPGAWSYPTNITVYPNVPNSSLNRWPLDGTSDVAAFGYQGTGSIYPSGWGWNETITTTASQWTYPQVLPPWTTGAPPWQYQQQYPALNPALLLGGTVQWNDLRENITPEEADRRLQETRRLAAKNQIERQRAVRKGRRLLLHLLDEAQKYDYAKTGKFLVAGSDGKVYQLRKNGTTHELGADGTPLFSHCIHLSHSFIPEDTLIAVKLLLETDPGEFRRIANTTPLRVQPLAAAISDVFHEQVARILRVGDYIPLERLDGPAAIAA